MTSKQNEPSTALVPVKFSRLTRRGILLGLSLSQLITLATGVLSLVVALYAGGGLLLAYTAPVWVLAAAILNGSLWRLPAGMLADRFGGRRMMTLLLLLATLPTLLVAWVNSYVGLLVLAFLVGFAGNAFSAGIAWNSAWQPREHQGFALGLFGAGNVGASVTKFIGPPLIAGTAGATYFGFVDGGSHAEATLLP